MIRSIVTAILCVLGSALLGYLRIDGYRSESFQALAHFWVCGLLVSGWKNVLPEIVFWDYYERPLGHWFKPSWRWYQIGLGVGLSILESVMALKQFGVIR